MRMLKFKRSQGKQKSSKPRGTVTILVLLFVASAGLRIASSANIAFAEIDAESAEEISSEATTSDRKVPEKEELGPLLRAFQEREERIRTKEAQIERRLEVLNKADEQITKRLSELKTAEEELRATIALANTAAEDDLVQLTVVYENMKPKTAAALFEEMAPDFAAGFLGRMRPDVAAAIMAGMKPESAYTVSTILAGRNANIPKE